MHNIKCIHVQHSCNNLGLKGKWSYPRKQEHVVHVYLDSDVDEIGIDFDLF